MWRIVHFNAFFVAGFCSKQNIIWITDQDEIAANDEKLKELTVTFSHVLSHYLSHDVNHIRVGTTALDDGSRSWEDLVAVTDLAAGALSEVVTQQVNDGLLIGGGLLNPPPIHLKPKVANLMNWFASNRQPLKRMVFLLDNDPRGKYRIRRLRFHGTLDKPDLRYGAPGL